VRSAKDYKAHFLLFPSSSPCSCSATSMSPPRPWPVRAGPDGARVRRSAVSLRLARETGIYIIDGNRNPVFERGKVFNAAHPVHRQRAVFRQKKVPPDLHRERPLPAQPRPRPLLYQHRFGNIAILVCYDVEFPEVARVWPRPGAEFSSFPPAPTRREAFCRVRYLRPGPRH